MLVSGSVECSYQHGTPRSIHQPRNIEIPGHAQPLQCRRNRTDHLDKLVVVPQGFPKNQSNQHKKYMFCVAIGSMGLVHLQNFLIYHLKSTIHVGKYTSPIDPMSLDVYQILRCDRMTTLMGAWVKFGVRKG